MLFFLIFFLSISFSCFYTNKKHLEANSNEFLLSLTENMYMHGWNSYLRHAKSSKSSKGNEFYYDSLAPIKCGGFNEPILGGNSLTLIDAADTLAVMGRVEKFKSSISLMKNLQIFDKNVTVSVFETGIRILGGLISNHIFAKRLLEKYDGHLLLRAKDLGDRLLRSFTESPTYIPFSNVNLRYGPDKSQYSSVCIACAGSIILEFGYLSELTGDPKYYIAAKSAMVEIFNKKSSLDLLGSSISTITGNWTNSVSSIKAESDSFYEYLWKAYLAFNDEDFFIMFQVTFLAIEKHQRRGNVYFDVEKDSGEIINSGFGALECFWAGILTQIGHLDLARRSLKFYESIAQKYDFLVPESTTLDGNTLKASYYIHRPELIESIFFMSTVFPEDTELTDFAKKLLKSIEKNCRSKCGYFGIDNVKESIGKKIDHQQSFLLAELLKYHFLTYDSANRVRTKSWIFTTEAHPLPVLVHSNSMKYCSAKFTSLSSARIAELKNHIHTCNAIEWRQMKIEMQIFRTFGKKNDLKC